MTEDYLELRRHVQDEHPDISLYLRNDVLAAVHRYAHGPATARAAAELRAAANALEIAYDPESVEHWLMETRARADELDPR